MDRWLRREWMRGYPAERHCAIRIRFHQMTWRRDPALERILRKDRIPKNIRDLSRIAFKSARRSVYSAVSYSALSRFE
jgi:hypothetical protein